MYIGSRMYGSVVKIFIAIRTRSRIEKIRSLLIRVLHMERASEAENEPKDVKQKISTDILTKFSWPTASGLVRAPRSSAPVKYESRPSGLTKSQQQP